MPDMTTIGAVLGSIKTATEIAKFLRTADLSIEQAEMKLKLADLLGALAEAKIEVVEVQEALAEKDKLIDELREAFSNKDLLVRHYDAYYEKNQNGEAGGIAFCLRCWESDHKKRQLIFSPKDHFVRSCTSCGQQFEARRTGDIQPVKA